MELPVETAFSGFPASCVEDISSKVPHMAKNNVREPGLYSNGNPVDALWCEAVGTAPAKERPLTVEPVQTTMKTAQVRGNQSMFVDDEVLEKEAAEAAPARDAVAQLAAEVDRLPKGSEEQFRAFQKVLAALDDQHV